MDVRQLHRVIGDEARKQAPALLGDDPDVVTACVGGGSNTLGISRGSLTRSRLVGVEPRVGQRSLVRSRSGARHAQLPHATNGQVEEAHSISAGLDYPGIGGNSYRVGGQAEYPTVTDDEVVDAFQLLSQTEGIIPALEPAHALAWVVREAHTMQGQTVLLICQIPATRCWANDGRIEGSLVTLLISQRRYERYEMVAETARLYITGIPGLARRNSSLRSDGGAVEIGIPFSDPVMDGPVIQQASQAALEGGTTPQSVLEEVPSLDVDIPLAVMTYYSLVHHDGPIRFASRQRRASPVRFCRIFPWKSQTNGRLPP